MNINDLNPSHIGSDLVFVGCLAYLLNRMKNLENRLESIRAHLGAPTAKQNRKRALVTTLGLSGAILAAHLLTGCASQTVSLSSSGSGSNEVRQVKVTTRSLFSGHASVEKLRASNGKTLSTGLTGLETETQGGTNLVPALNAAADLLRAARP